MDKEVRDQALKPCPFCAATGEEVAICYESGEMPATGTDWFVRCYVCHVETERLNPKAAAMSAWNRRAQSAEADHSPDGDFAENVGRESWAKGRTIDENPYLPGTLSFYAWRSGWRAGLEAERDALRARADELERRLEMELGISGGKQMVITQLERRLGEATEGCERWRQDYLRTRDALWQFENQPDPKMLRKIADDIDCCPGCESISYDPSTGTSECRKEGTGECPNEDAETLRGLASAIETRAAAFLSADGEGG